MHQVLHIFRKDVRHHWPEIAASLALLVSFAGFDIRSWSEPSEGFATGAVAFFFTTQMLAGLVNVLLPLSWIFLIVRAVQDESLVGDRQFWVTRPYDWKQLLVAKALFGLAFISFPFFCMDAFLLVQAGFRPTHYIIGLLWLQAMWILFLFLWLTALASVTRSTAQLLLAVLLIVLDLIGTSALSSAIHKSDLSGSFNSWWGLVVIGVAVIIILLQYSRRRTAPSRWLIVGVCGVLTLTSLASSRATPPDRSSILREYPLSSGIPPVELGLEHTDTHQGQFAPLYNDQVSIELPLGVNGISNDSILKLDGMIVTMTNAKGLRWDSGWKTGSQWLFPEQKTAQFGFQIQQNAFDQLKSSPVTADFFLAFTLYQNKSRQEFVVPSGEFRLPDVGLCTAGNKYSRGIHCLAPLRRPAFLLVSSEAANSTCLDASTDTPSPRGIFLHDFVQGWPGPAEMGISSVRQIDIAFSDWDSSTRRPVSPGICAGTAITLSKPQETGRRGMELQIENLSIEDFRERLPTRR